MVHNSIMLSYKNTILYCLSLLGLLILTQCTTKADNETFEYRDHAGSQFYSTCIIGDFDLFSTNIDCNDHPVYGEQNIDMKCRWNDDGTIIRNTAGIEQRGTWSVVDDSLLVVKINAIYQTKGLFMLESPTYETSIIQQCNDHHLILTSSSNGYTSTITWVRRPE